VGKKQPAKKPNLEETLVVLRQRFQGRLAPPLEGLAYRFTIWLPVQSQGRPVFSELQRIALTTFFYDCFGGCSQTSIEGYPPWTGSWLPAGAAQPIIDEHILIVIYALQAKEAVTCLRQLKWVLQQEQVAAQEVVLIEQVPVQLLEAAELS
jgi:hypothetical protein